MPSRALLTLVMQAATYSAWFPAPASGVVFVQQPVATPADSKVVALAATDTGRRLGPRLSLTTVINQTLEHSPTYATAEGTVRTARSAQRVALGNYLPNVSTTGIVLRSNQSITSTGITVRDAYGAGVTTSVPIFTSGYRRAVRRETAALTRAANAGLVLERFAVRLLAKEGFFEVLRGHELVQVGQEAVAVASKNLQYARTRLTAGTATPADVLQAELALTSAQRQLLAARDTVFTAAALLGRLVGADGLVDAEPPANLDPTPLPMSDSAIVTAAVLDAPMVRQADAQVSATAAAVRAAKAQYFPTFSTGAGYIWSNNALAPSAPRRGWNVLFGASWPLFNGFQREDSVTRSDVAAHVARVTSADTRRLSGAEARQLLGNLYVAEQDVTLTQESVRVANVNLRLVTVRYRGGIATILDLLTAQELLIRAELDLVSARFTYQLARASLEALLGRELLG